MTLWHLSQLQFYIDFCTYLVHVLFSGFPFGSAVKNPRAMQETACNAGDVGSVPGWGRSPGEGNGNPLQYSCLGNPMDRGAWWAPVHAVTRVRHN